MSVTFFLSSGETAYPSCPACGGTITHDPAPDRDCGHESCQGYGPDPVKSTPELNVANGNAHVIIRLLLGYESADIYGGELDADDVKLRLSMAGYRADGAVRPTVRQGNMIDCGLPLERIQQYIEVLSEIAEIASRRGEPILYG